MADDSIAALLRSNAQALAEQAKALLERPDLGERPVSLALAITNGTAAIILSSLADVVTGVSLEDRIVESTKKRNVTSEYFNAIRSAQNIALRTGDYTEYDRLIDLGLAGYKSQTGDGSGDTGAGTATPASTQ